MDAIRLLLVEDDKDLRVFLKECLEMTGEYIVYEAKNGLEGINAFKELELDIIVTDIDMPKVSGIEMIDFIRKENSHIPILITSALTKPDQVKVGLQHDADNYIKKPFTNIELDNYIKSIFRRIAKSNQPIKEENKVFPLGAYLFDLENRCLIFEGKNISLSKRESQILKMLYQGKGRVVKRSIILKDLWGEEDDIFQSRSLDVFINTLRNHLKKDNSIAIVNYRSYGLKLIC